MGLWAPWRAETLDWRDWHDTGGDLAATARTLIRKPASEVFDAFVNPETMSKFWFTRRDDGLRKGETVTWYLGARPDAPQIEVRVRSLERPR